MAYIYKAKNQKNGTKFRTIWGRICKAHGRKGVVIARFSPNLPARAMGATLRVMLFPQRGWLIMLINIILFYFWILIIKINESLIQNFCIEDKYR